jgi:hemerythrin superfamily protein
MKEKRKQKNYLYLVFFEQRDLGFPPIPPILLFCHYSPYDPPSPVEGRYKQYTPSFSFPFNHFAKMEYLLTANPLLPSSRIGITRFPLLFDLQFFVKMIRNEKKTMPICFEGAGASIFIKAKGEVMEIYEVLKQDHVEAKQLFNDLQSGAGGDRQKLFGKLEKELTIHMEGEEKLFYPQLKGKLADNITEAIEEHNKTREHLDQMKSAKDESEWQETLQELVEGVDHHIEEEESEIFQKARKILNKQQAEQIGEVFEHEKQNKMTLH